MCMKRQEKKMAELVFLASVDKIDFVKETAKYQEEMELNWKYLRNLRVSLKKKKKKKKWKI